MYIENNNKHLTKKHNICIGSHKKQLLLFSLSYVMQLIEEKAYDKQE